MTANKCSKQYQLRDKISSLASFFFFFAMFLLSSIVRLLKFSFPDFFNVLIFSLAINFNHFFNFVLKQFRAERDQKKTVFFIVVKRFRALQKAHIAFHFIFQFHPVSLNIQATATSKKLFRLILSAEILIFSLLLAERNFHLWSKQRVFKEACRCLRDSYFSARQTHKKHFATGNAGKGKKKV